VEHDDVDVVAAAVEAGEVFVGGDPRADASDNDCSAAADSSPSAIFSCR
jgi:hypothetical protein